MCYKRPYNAYKNIHKCRSKTSAWNFYLRNWKKKKHLKENSCLKFRLEWWNEFYLTFCFRYKKWERKRQTLPAHQLFDDHSISKKRVIWSRFDWIEFFTSKITLFYRTENETFLSIDIINSHLTFSISNTFGYRRDSKVN